MLQKPRAHVVVVVVLVVEVVVVIVVVDVIEVVCVVIVCVLVAVYVAEVVVVDVPVLAVELVVVVCVVSVVDEVVRASHTLSWHTRPEGQSAVVAHPIFTANSKSVHALLQYICHMPDGGTDLALVMILAETAHCWSLSKSCVAVVLGAVSSKTHFDPDPPPLQSGSKYM